MTAIFPNKKPTFSLPNPTPEIETISEACEMLGAYQYYSNLIEKEDFVAEDKKYLRQEYGSTDPDDILDCLAKKLHATGMDETECHALIETLSEIKAGYAFAFFEADHSSGKKLQSKLNKRLSLVYYNN